MKFVLYLTILLSAFNLLAQPISVPLNEHQKDKQSGLFDFRIEYGTTSASMLYNHNGMEVLDDTLTFIDSNGEASDYPYTTDLTQQRYSLYFGYIGIKDLFIYAKLPITHTRIQERLKYDSTLSIRYDRNIDTKTYVDGLTIDAGYKFDFGNVGISLLGSVFIPIYKYSSTTDTLDLPINNKHIELGSPFETRIGTLFDAYVKPVTLQLGATYNQRGDGFADRMLYHFQIGLGSVANTQLYANVGYIQSFGHYDDKYKAIYWRQVLWEKYVDVNVGFSIFLDESIYANVGYNVKLWGENSLATRQLNINLGYIIF